MMLRFFVLRFFIWSCWWLLGACISAAQVGVVDRQTKAHSDSLVQFFGEKNSVGSLYFDMHALSFFLDNEYGGDIAKGYTLPGFWVQPRLYFAPSEFVSLELGTHALVYHGANKYPNYAYHDLPLWKGSQYQSAAHVLPFFRTALRLGRNQRLVLGNLYGALQHRLVRPLYNPELVFSADPEKGLQYLFWRNKYQLDVWVDWESFIFDKDNHQEALVFGVAQRVVLLEKNKHFRLQMPLQLLAQHRGGEQDVPNHGVQTLVNIAFGLQAQLQAQRKWFSSLDFEAYALLARQKDGKLWPFDRGVGFYTAIGGQILPALHMNLGYFQAKDFVSLYGSPFFSTLSLKENARFSRMKMLHCTLEYTHSFGSSCVLGLHVDNTLSAAGRLLLSNETSRSPKLSHAFSAVLFFRIQPSFLLKTFAR